MERIVGRRQRGYFVGVALAISILAGILGGRVLIDRGLVGSEDNLLFYMMGLNLVAAEQLESMADDAIDHFSARTDDPHALLRLDFRKTYLNEFPLPGAVYLAVSRSFKAMFDVNRSLYPLYLSQTLVFGLTAAMVLSVVAAVFLVRATRRPVHLWALAFTLLLFALSEFLPIDANSYATILVHDGFGGVATHLGELLARPGPQFSPLGFTPRGHFGLLLIAVFALRWSNRYRMAYLLVLGLSFVHLSTSALILLTLLAIDLVLRPALFRDLKTGGIVLFTTVVVMGRQTMWQLLGDNGLVVVLVAVAAFAAAIAMLRLPFLRHPLDPVIRGALVMRGWFIGSNKVVSDLRFLLVGWGITFIALYAVIAVFEPFSPLSKFYFWGRLHGRMAGVLWPSVIFGVVLLALMRAKWFGVSKKKVVSAVTVLGTALLLVSGYPGVTSMLEGKVLNRVTGDFVRVEERLYGDPLRTLRPMGFEEKVLYYGMCKSVDLRENYLKLFLR